MSGLPQINFGGSLFSGGGGGTSTSIATSTNPLTLTSGTPGAATTTGLTTGFLGAPQPVAPQPTQPPVTTGGGLGGIPHSGAPRVSTLALGTDPGTGWSTRGENKAVHELPVPPEILAAVEELKTQMEGHKTMMATITRTSELDIELVVEQIEEVRMQVTTLVNLMHKQELQSASLIKDMQEVNKDVDLLSKAKDTLPGFGFGSTPALLHNFLCNLIEKYSARMMKYKVEIERAEFSLQTIMGAQNINAKDLWASLTAIKDTVILLAAQIHQLHEDVRNELNVHRNVSRVLYATSPKPWLANAISGLSEAEKISAPLEQVLSTPSKAAASTPTIETMYQRTYSMLHSVPSLNSRALLQEASESHQRPPPYPGNINMLGSFIGSSSSASPASLKRPMK